MTERVKSPRNTGGEEKNRRPKIFVVKYFEESDKYAKIIPRPVAHILKRRNKTPPTKDEVLKLTTVTGRDLIGLIENDQVDWMQKYNPIEAVLLYNEAHNKLDDIQF
jgi:hypothetical protein